jgi:hypothetical protein
VLGAADVGGLDPRAADFESVQLFALGCEPVVRERDRQPGVERELRQLRPDVARPQYEERTLRSA